MKIKNKYKKICLLFVMLMMSCFVLNSVAAAITSDANGGVGKTQSTFGSIANGIVDVLGYVGEMAASGLFATVTSLITMLTVALFLVLEVVFVVGTGDITHIPMPDTIVFNRFAFFDPNFINPASNSLIASFKNVLGNVFASFHTIAISIFIIAAMIAGLQMALSSVASKKAQYKEAALKWVSGFLILICLRWILAAVFYVNELLVSSIYSIASSYNLSIPIYVTDAVPVFGTALTDLIKGVASIWGTSGTSIHVSGYLGIVFANITKGIGGDIVASIVGFIILGQTLTIIGAYIKRTFMCILLGVMSPLIVAADTIMASTGNKSNIFANWLKNFVTTVFMQSIHAVYMLVVLQILSALYATPTVIYENDKVVMGMTRTQISIVTIVLTTGLVKMEKIIKGMFGIGDSLAGDLKSGAAGIVSAMGAARGIAAGTKAIADNAPKMKDAAKRKQAYQKEIDILKAPARSEEARKAAIAAKNAGNMDEYHKQMKIADEYRRQGKQGTTVVNNTTNNNNSKNGGGDYLEQVIKNQNNNLTRENQIQKLEEGIAKETANFKSARLAAIMGPANLAAGIGIGIGMDDNMGESLFKGGHITAVLDKGTEFIGGRSADKDRKTYYEHEKSEGQKLGYTASEKIIREKTVVEKQLQNPQLYVNPVAVGKEIAKQFHGIGDVLSDTMKKELRNIDRDIDNQ